MSDEFKFTTNTKGWSPEAIADGLAKGFTEVFGRSFTTQVSKVDGRIVVVATEQVSDSEVWTVNDVAIYTQQEPDKILRMCQTRAVQNARREGRTPIPFKKVDAKTVQFSRKDVIAWLAEMKPPVTATFVKGKFRKVKK
jgi:D-alanyl-D-alanine carboxypeptidase